VTQQTVDPQVQEALWDLQRYLSDEVAPMMVTDSIEILLRCPPDVAADQIHGWLTTQTTGVTAAPVSDCLFHAMKKLHLMAEFNLIEENLLDRYLSELGQLVLGFCPEQDRQMLSDNLENLNRAVDSATASRVEHLHRQAGGAVNIADRPAVATTPGTPPQQSVQPRPATAAVPAADASANHVDLERGLKRLTFILERIGHSEQPAEPERALNLAALNARNGAEFEGYLARLRESGLEVDAGEVFRSLASALPGWTLPEGSAVPPSRSVEAMHRLISKASDPAVGASRFSEMVNAAIGQFNEGSFVQAQMMFDLANRIVDEKQLKPEVVQSIKMRGDEHLSVQRLHEASQEPALFPALRTVLEFFPTYSPKEILEALQNEPRREKRKLQLALLEAQGRAARVETLDMLAFFAGDLTNDPHGYFQRNLVYLLRRIDRPDDGSEEELPLLVRSSELDQPPIVIREAIGALANWPHTLSERALIERLGQIEATMSGKQDTLLPRGQVEALLNRTIAALAKVGTANTIRAIVDHGFNRQTPLGDTMARLAVLGSYDLSSHADVVDQLTGALRKALPSRVLGFVMHKNTAQLIWLIRALAMTPSSSVGSLMEEIVERFSDHEFAESASKVLESFGATRPSGDPQASLNGDVELFGLPNLLQSLADSQLTGTLTLVDREHKPFATLDLEDRMLVGCTTGSLNGETAFWQLFEKPTPGTFSFKRGKPEHGDGEPFEVMPSILEALRRHDEYNAARAVVPDEADLVTGPVTPTPCEDEDDLAFMRSVWVKASSGATPEKCEAAIASDGYRIRRLFVHWIETGALRPA